MRGIHKAARLCVFFAIIVGKFLSTRYAKSFGIAEKSLSIFILLKKRKWHRPCAFIGTRIGNVPDPGGDVMTVQPNQFKCHSCGRSFSSEDQLREHAKTCSGPRPHGG